MMVILSVKVNRGLLYAEMIPIKNFFAEITTLVFSVIALYTGVGIYLHSKKFTLELCKRYVSFY